MHSSICDYCKHKWRGDYRCDAWPEEPGIPYEVATDGHDHRFPHPGDRGIRFELDLTLPPAMIENFRAIYEDDLHLWRLKFWHDRGRLPTPKEEYALYWQAKESASEEGARPG
jgi:hypothetical protein